MGIPFSSVLTTSTFLYPLGANTPVSSDTIFFFFIWLLLSPESSRHHFLGFDGVFSLEFNLLWCYGMVVAREFIFFLFD
jgi:hypothetical protein